MTDRRARSIPRCTAFCLSVGVSVAVSSANGLADPSHRTGRRSSPAKIGRSAPDATSTIAKPPAPGPLPSDDQTVPPPFNLPIASRERTRECGARWQGMKMAGTNGDDDWRDFAMKCLTDTRGEPR